MKTIMKRTIRDEKGAVLIMVLVLLVVGGLILTPLLGLMSTGLLAGKVYEKKMYEYYAADAGIQDALWKIQHDIEIPADGYNLTVNDKYVHVTMASIDVGQFMLDLLGVEAKNWVHSEWLITARTPEDGVFNITMTWNGTATKKKINSVGAWLAGTYYYVEGLDPGDDDIRTAYPDYTFDPEGFSFGGGTAFIWEWEDSVRPELSQNETVTLSFRFTPENIPSGSIGWVRAGSEDVGPTYAGDLQGGTISATAISYIDTATADIGSQTTVIAGVFVSGCPGSSEINIASWDIS
jgi:hypothetical protein